MVTAALSVAGHLAILAVLLTAHGATPPLAEPEPMRVELVTLRPTPDVIQPPAPAPPAPVTPPPRRTIARPAKAPTHPDPVPAGPTEEPDVGLSDAQIASAATVGSGPPGGPCDMARRLQAALRKDPQVQAAVADAHRATGPGGKAMLVWNGDWIRSHGQDGAGLAAVREAIMWEVAFAPAPCRTEPVHGLVLISMNDGPGSARLVVGSGAWRWSDLLRPRPGA